MVISAKKVLRRCGARVSLRANVRERETVAA
jgi:ribosomal protein L40E